MLDKLELKITFKNIFKFVSFSGGSFLLSLLFLNLIGDNFEAKLFSLSLFFLMLIIPVLYLLISYIIINFNMQIRIDKYDLIVNRNTKTTIYKIEEINELMVYRNKTVDSPGYLPVSNMIDFYYLDIIMNDKKSIVVTCLMIDDLEMFLSFFGVQIKRTYITHGVMLLERRD